MSPSCRAFCVILCCAGLAACATKKVEVKLPSPPPPAAEPQGYVGMQAPAVRAMFGVPAFTRRDGKDEMWRYDAAQCKAFFFLYPDGNGLQLRHVETLPRGQAESADPACLNALRAQASSPVS